MTRIWLYVTNLRFYIYINIIFRCLLRLQKWGHLLLINFYIKIFVNLIWSKKAKLFLLRLYFFVYLNHNIDYIIKDSKYIKFFGLINKWAFIIRLLLRFRLILINYLLLKYSFDACLIRYFFIFKFLQQF